VPCISVVSKTCPPFGVTIIARMLPDVLYVHSFETIASMGIEELKAAVNKYHPLNRTKKEDKSLNL